VQRPIIPIKVFALKNRSRLEFSLGNVVMKKTANTMKIKKTTAGVQKHHPGNHPTPISRLLSHIQKKFQKKIEKSCNKKTSSATIYSATIYIVFDDW